MNKKKVNLTIMLVIMILTDFWFIASIMILIIAIAVRNSSLELESQINNMILLFLGSLYSIRQWELSSSDKYNKFCQTKNDISLNRRLNEE